MSRLSACRSRRLISASRRGRRTHERGPGKRSTHLKISQQRKARGGTEQMLDRMSAEDKARMNGVVEQLEQFGKRVERAGGRQVEGAGISRRKQHEQQRYCQGGEELHPTV